MGDELPSLPLTPERLPARPAGIDTLMDEFVAGRKKTTSDAYSRDLRRFADYLGVDSIVAAAKHLFGADHGTANRIAAAYKAHLLSRKLSSATINRYMASLKAFSAFANFVGLVPWELKTIPVKHEERRIARGPDGQGFELLLKQASQQSNVFKATRDRAMLWVFYALALRENEVVHLDMKDVDLDGSQVKITGKGRREQEYRTISPQAKEALRAWIELRGSYPGAVFVGRTAPGAPLHPMSVYKIIQRLGRGCGMKVWPHALRHCGITAVMKSKKYSLREIQKFSRHKDLNTLVRYEDDLSDVAGDIAGDLSTWVKDPGIEKSP